MDTKALIAQAEAELQSVALYRYNPKVLEEIIERGTMEEGSICLVTVVNGGRYAQLVYYADRFEKVVDGKVEQTMPMSEKAFEVALREFAKREAKRRLVN